jgi:hypothetical protein
VLYIYKAVCVLESLVSLRENLAVHCAVLVRKKKKKKVRFFSLVQDTHKEINWGFL